MSDSSDPTDYSLPGSPVHGIFQARVLEWVAIAFSKVVSNSLQSVDCSMSGSSVHGIFQARVLEWGAIAFSSWSLLKLISIKSVMPSNHLNLCHLFLLLL